MFPPNTVVPYEYNGQTYDIDFNSVQEGKRDDQATYAAITSRSYHGGLVNMLFLDGSEFKKGIPSMVCNLDELLAQFGEKDKAAAQRKVEAFKPHWELLQKNALGGA